MNKLTQLTQLIDILVNEGISLPQSEKEYKENKYIVRKFLVLQGVTKSDITLINTALKLYASYKGSKSIKQCLKEII